MERHCWIRIREKDNQGDSRLADAQTVSAILIIKTILSQLFSPFFFFLVLPKFLFFSTRKTLLLMKLSIDQLSSFVHLSPQLSDSSWMCPSSFNSKFKPARCLIEYTTYILYPCCLSGFNILFLYKFECRGYEPHRPELSPLRHPT